MNDTMPIAERKERTRTKI